MIRQVKKEDSKRIWEIRNHPIARQYSNNPEVIPFARHDKWFRKKYFSGQKNYCFILESAAGEAIGYCRFDFDMAYAHYIISIALDPDFHGKGLGNELLSKALEEFKKGKIIIAETRKDNEPSVKLFKKNHFKIYKEDEQNYYLKYKF